MTHEEAINEIKSWDFLNEKESEAVRTLIPELRESEDERVRKWLVEYFGSIKETVWIHRDITCEQILEWLEKQKEPIVDKEGMYYYLGGKFIYCGYPATEENPYDFAMSQQEKQKEQKPEYPFTPDECIKPAEWSEEDKTRLTNILIMLQEYVIHHYSKDDVNKSVDWLKALPERFNLQPKPEWSEEDEDMLNSCISSIEEAKENRYAYKETDGDTSYDHEIAWLKSLRPSWKPGEEQMVMLRAVINDPNNAGAEGCQLALRELYEHLKKL